MQPSRVDPLAAAHARSVVLVEDDAIVREQLVAAMRAAGIDVLAAVSGVARGYDAVVGTDPDVAVLDDRLPDGLGVDLCRRLAADRPGVRVVVHAAAMTTTEQRAALDAGAVAVVSKNVRPDALLHAVLCSPRQFPGRSGAGKVTPLRSVRPSDVRTKQA
ncbi:response regulator transcription factor [Kineosporia sp. A_224]|uniref:response regulator n=1 Tax=Kineosporia sp. A_224 TaxID=1962180 RepID=UPI000B4AFFCF|nr:response regulator transcription factor [Kineosporia sp. A_224]